MNLSIKSSLLVALALISTATPALANKAANIATGTVSSVQGHQVVVDGVAYNVANNKTMNNALLGIEPGQRVQLILDNTPGAPGAKVQLITVQPH
jgi:hypothetical protein